jgi:hypothetical protein
MIDFISLTRSILRKPPIWEPPELGYRYEAFFRLFSPSNSFVSNNSMLVSKLRVSSSQSRETFVRSRTLQEARARPLTMYKFGVPETVQGPKHTVYPTQVRLSVALGSKHAKKQTSSANLFPMAKRKCF